MKTCSSLIYSSPQRYESKQEIKELLLYFEPLVQKNWIPVTNDQSIGQASARTKFSHIDDSLLLIGITKFGAKYFKFLGSLLLIFYQKK